LSGGKRPQADLKELASGLPKADIEQPHMRHRSKNANLSWISVPKRCCNLEEWMR